MMFGRTAFGLAFILTAAGLACACGENLMVRQDDPAPPPPKETASAPFEPRQPNAPSQGGPDASTTTSSTPEAGGPAPLSQLAFLGSCAWGPPADGNGCSILAGHAVATFYQVIASGEIVVHNRIENSQVTICEEKPLPPNLGALRVGKVDSSDLQWMDPSGEISGVTVNWMTRNVVQQAMAHNALDMAFHPPSESGAASCWLVRAPQ
jgi:hypothetical protein